MNRSSRRARVWKPIALAATITFGVLYLHWKSMTEPIPGFDELRVVSTRGMRSDLYCKTSCSLTFHDEQGHRYETPYLPRAQTDTLLERARDRSLDLYYGAWDAPFASDDIFTVYQIQDGAKILMDYQEQARAKTEQQSVAVPVVVFSVIGISLAVALGLKLGGALQRGPTQRRR